MLGTKERTQIVREKVKKKDRIKKHRDRRYNKSDEKAMNQLLLDAKKILNNIW